MSLQGVFGPLFGNQWGLRERSRLPPRGRAPLLLVDQVLSKNTPVYIPSRYNMSTLDEIGIPGYATQETRITKQLNSIFT
jgi:hypothetical protein